jgi:hypothetical protein
VTANTQDTRLQSSIGARSRAAEIEIEGENLDEAQEHRRALFCIAIGTDPAGREHRIKIRETGTGFAMIDSRRRCRVNAHWACRLTQDDIAKEVAFVFRVRVKCFEFPGFPASGEPPTARARERKAKYWKAWGRKTVCAQA